MSRSQDIGFLKEMNRTAGTLKKGLEAYDPAKKYAYINQAEALQKMSDAWLTELKEGQQVMEFEIITGQDDQVKRGLSVLYARIKEEGGIVYTKDISTVWFPGNDDYRAHVKITAVITWGKIVPGNKVRDFVNLFDL